MSAPDLILRGGTVIDGTGAPPHRADVAVTGERIVALGDLRRQEARQILDVSGLFVTPGFIDIHAHSDLTLLVDPRAASKVRQGVTSEISGQCGLSAAPVVGMAREELGVWAARFGLELRWSSLREYLDLVERQGVALNFGLLAGHANLRYAVVGGADRPAGPAECEEMARMLAQALEEGALGLSSGLFYAPGSYADLAELAVLGQVAAAHGGLYATHMRNEASHLEQALEEAIAVARISAVPVEISHLKLASRAHWGGAGQLLARLDAARAEGLALGWDQYPYTVAATTLDAVVPPPFHAGGTAALLERLASPTGRLAIAAALAADTQPDWENLARDPGWAAITLTFHPTRPELTGRTIAEIAADRGSDPLQTALDLLLETGNQAECTIACMDERDVAAILRHPGTAVATDAEALAADGPLAAGVPHPRSYGTFPRVLGRYVRQQRLLTWEEAVHRMTGLPAARLGLRDRGVLRVGAFADLVILDPEVVAARATFGEPHQYPQGIRHVVVNGRFAVFEEEQTDARPGRALRWG